MAEPATGSRGRRWSWLWFLLFVTGIVFCMRYRQCQPAPPEPASTPVTECRVSFFMGENREYADVCLEDKSLIDRLVLEPMKHAKLDPQPAEYVVLGTLTIHLPNQPEETIPLYLPWGHYDRGNKAFVTDFSELQTACKTALEHAQRMADRDQ